MATMKTIVDKVKARKVVPDHPLVAEYLKTGSLPIYTDDQKTLGKLLSDRAEKASKHADKVGTKEAYGAAWDAHRVAARGIVGNPKKSAHHDFQARLYGNEWLARSKDASPSPSSGGGFTSEEATRQYQREWQRDRGGR